MRANSCGLETCIRGLGEEEIKLLKNGPIEGILSFREVMEEGNKGIPFELKCDVSQRDLVVVDLIPDETYFGDATKIIFTINRKYYDELFEAGQAVEARFFNGVGKLELYSESHSY
ncbi:hypothetical protein HN832_01540 [archaeon]|jgi:hypothetical protein|nr:hypothetical protein [archaeon]MBT4373933.1 hypothetical protein [archaeon]MBT4532326.1 hypothetical protein [archaeon]MBT7001912.1 hypothetical protein [archaeon]MBT7282075.1 hypothetical protein [archaeon]